MYLFVMSIQVQDYYLTLRLNDVGSSVMSLYKLLGAVIMLQNTKIPNCGASHNYSKMIMSYLMIVEHWRQSDHYVVDMMRAGMSVVNEETGEMSFSILGRCVLGDHVKSDFDHMSSMYEMLPVYNAISKDVSSDCNKKDTISWRHKVDVNSDEVRGTSLFFRQTIRAIVLNRYKSYTGTELSYSNKIAGSTCLTEKCMPVIYKEDVSMYTTEICKRLARDLNTNTFMEEHRDLWPTPNEDYETTSTGGSEQKDDEVLNDQQPVEWGADWDECIVGSFAVVHTEFTEDKIVKSGVCVFKIMEKHGENAQPVNGAGRTFKGMEYLCTSDNTQLSCVNATWNYIEGQSKMSEIVDWNVIAYVSSLRQGKKLPVYVANSIERHANDDELFYEWVENDEPEEIQ